MTATSLPVRVRSRGHHHRPLWPVRALQPLKRKLARHNAKPQRTRQPGDVFLLLMEAAIPGAVRWTAEELRRARPRHQARKGIARLIMLSSAPAYSGDGHYLPAVLTSVGLCVASLILLAVMW